jgi:hypothetical protein
VSITIQVEISGNIVPDSGKARIKVRAFSSAWATPAQNIFTMLFHRHHHPNLKRLPGTAILRRQYPGRWPIDDP